MFSRTSEFKPLKFESPELLQQLIDKYFDDCDKDGRPYTTTGLARALNTSRQTLINYSDREGYFDTIRNAKLRCEQWAVENALLGKANATFSIFNLKNNHGWKDQTEQNQTLNINFNVTDFLNKLEGKGDKKDTIDGDELVEVED